MTAQLQWHAPKISPFWWPVDLTAAPIAPAPPAIGAPILSAGLICPCCRGRGLIQRPAAAPLIEAIAEAIGGRIFSLAEL
jgi:hypothetical protein